MLLDHYNHQCDSDGDCAAFQGHPSCESNLCVPSSLGPPGCFSGTYYEAKVPDGAAPATCKQCSGPADCSSDKPACNNGYCERK